MSILIKGVEMPTDCRECPLEMYYMNCGETRCRATRRTLATDFESIPFDGRADDCPLIELPPHGRLIDADALRQTMYHEAFETDSPMQKWDSGCWIRYKMFENMEDSAPTIIPAEPCNDLAKPNIDADYPPSTPLEQVWTELFGEDGGEKKNEKNN